MSRFALVSSRDDAATFRVHAIVGLKDLTVKLKRAPKSDTEAFTHEECSELVTLMLESAVELAPTNECRGIHSFAGIWDPDKLIPVDENGIPATTSLEKVAYKSLVLCYWRNSGQPFVLISENESGGSTAKKSRVLGRRRK